ncbi:hypothetical protein K2X30_00710 [bacterium]|jgi:hypothetical protein|nr:hypothetical protein [bacterium]
MKSKNLKILIIGKIALKAVLLLVWSLNSAEAAGPISAVMEGLSGISPMATPTIQFKKKVDDGEFANIDKTHRECTQDCYYSLGNQHIILGFLTDAKLYNTLEERMKAGDYTTVYSNLKEFCQATGTASSADESEVKSCFEVYRLEKVRYFRETRNKMAENSDKASQLRNGVSASYRGPASIKGGEPESVDFQRSDDQSKKKAIVPYVPKYATLQKRHDNFMPKSISEDYQAWKEDFKGKREPQREDFPKFVERKKDLTDKSPKAEMITVLVKDGAGRPLVDEEAWAKAHREWAEQNPKGAERDASEKKIAAALDAYGAPGSPKMVRGNLDQVTTQEQRDAFESARNVMVDVVNAGIVKNDESRKPASVKGSEEVAKKSDTSSAIDASQVAVKSTVATSDGKEIMADKLPVSENTKNQWLFMPSAEFDSQIGRMQQVK